MSTHSSGATKMVPDNDSRATMARYDELLQKAEAMWAEEREEESV